MFRPRMFGSSMIVAVAALISIATPAQAQTTLKYKFAEGEKLNYATEMTQKQTINVQGMEIETLMTQSMDMSWKVKAASEGKAEIVQSIDRIRMKMDSAFAAFEYDSKDGKEPEGPFGMILGPLFAAMAGSEFTVTMTDNGEVLESKISDKLSDALKNNAALQQLGAGFTEDGLKNMLGQSGSAMMPKSPVKKGDTWTQSIKLNMPPLGTMTMNHTYTYMGPETRDGTSLEKIDMKTELKIEPAAEVAAQISFKIKSSDVKGTLYFDSKKGRLVESTINTKMTMEIDAMGNIIDAVQDQTATTKLAK